MVSLLNLILTRVFRSILAAIIVDKTNLVENSLKNGTLSLVFLYVKMLTDIVDIDTAEMPNI